MSIWLVKVRAYGVSGKHIVKVEHSVVVQAPDENEAQRLAQDASDTDLPFGPRWSEITPIEWSKISLPIILNRSEKWV